MKALALRPMASSLAGQFALRGRPFSARRRARGSVLFGMLAVLFAHLWLAVQVETRKPEWRDPEFFHRQRHAAALVQWERSRGNNRPLIVILGGSRPQMGLSPDAIDKALGNGPTDPMAYNCSQSGCLPVGERLNLGRLLDAGLKPEFVLIEVLPPVLADPGPVDARIPKIRLSHADLLRLRPYQVDPDRVRSEWAKARLESWFTLRLPLIANWGLSEIVPGLNNPHHLWSGMTFNGWSPFGPREWSTEQRAEQFSVARRTYGWLLDDFRIQPVNDRLYRDMLTECRDRGIHAALYTMPESPTFRSWYTPAVRGQVNEYLGNLSREFGVPLFVTSTWIEDETAFMDGHHLIGEAAVKFSKRFGKDCVEPWVRGRTP